MIQKITVIGAGATGHAVAGVMSMRGFQVTLHDDERFQQELDAVKELGFIQLRGKIRGTGAPAKVTTDPAEAIHGAEAIFVDVPADRHEEVARRIAPHLEDGQHILIIPGNLGAFVFRRVFQELGVTAQVTLTEKEGNFCPCRLTAPAEVTVGLPLNLKGKVASLPASDTPKVLAALEGVVEYTANQNVFEGVVNAGNVINHIASTILSAAEIDHKGASFSLFKYAFTPSVVRCIRKIASEREAVINAMGMAVHGVPTGMIDKVLHLEEHPEISVFYHGRPLRPGPPLSPRGLRLRRCLRTLRCQAAGPGDACSGVLPGGGGRPQRPGLHSRRPDAGKPGLPCRAISGGDLQTDLILICLQAGEQRAAPLRCFSTGGCHEAGTLSLFPGDRAAALHFGGCPVPPYPADHLERHCQGRGGGTWLSHFSTDPGGVAATVPGEQFLVLAWEINLKYEELLSLKQRSTQEAPTIRLLLPPSVGSCLPVLLTNEFYQYDLRGNLTFEECISTAVGEQVQKGAANLGLAYLTEENISLLQSNPQCAELQLQRLLRDQIYLVVAKTHPLASLREVNMSQLYGERLASAKSVQNDAILGPILANWSRITRFPDVDLLKQAVLRQNMICFLPRYTILSEGSRLSPSQFSVIPVRNTARPNRLTLCLIHRPEEALSCQEKILRICILDCFWRFRTSHSGCFSMEDEPYANGISSLPSGN
nr:NAD/NADP octopine/nopaline dehydrogenase family protein [Pseudoflavonifractor phocaeensis]